MNIVQNLKQHPWVLPTIIFTILVLLGANMHPLWGDEAETALFARNILKYGVPKGWDGVNIMGIEDAAVLDKNLVNHSSPWAQYYLVALSFKLFGESSLSARLPFILLSTLILPLIYFLTLNITKNKFTSMLTLVISCLSVPLILFSFQARYFSLNIVVSLILAFFIYVIAKKGVIPKLIFALSGIIFFYSNYIVFVVFYISLSSAYFIYLLMKKDKFIKKFLVNWIALSFVISLFTLPWIIKFEPFATRIGFTPATGGSLIATIIDSYKHYNSNGVFPLLFIPILLVVFYRMVKQKKDDVSYLTFLVSLVIVHLLLMVGITSVPTNPLIFTEPRYTVCIIPFLIIISAILVNHLFQINKKLGILVLIIYLFTNLFTLETPRSLLYDFLRELNHPYQTPDIQVANYLKTNAEKGDTAFVNLDHAHEPLIFHLDGYIRFVDRISRINKRVFPENKSTLPRYIYDFRENPDWVILYSKYKNSDSFYTRDVRTLPAGINLSDYNETVIPTFFLDMSRPEIDYRSFAEITPLYKSQIFIYSLKK